MTHYDKEREADELWRNAPEGAEFYGYGKFRKLGENGRTYFFDAKSGWCHGFCVKTCMEMADYQERPQHTTKQPETAHDALNKYSRNIIGLDGKTCQVDVYRVLDAFEVDSHAIAHSIKKLLAPGLRHAKTREQDLKEAINSIEAELLLMEQRNV